MNANGFPIGPDPARVVLLPFTPAAELRSTAQGRDTRVTQILDRILTLDPEAAASQLAEVMSNFGDRHRDLAGRFAARAVQLGHGELTASQRQLAGAYFLMEYSFGSTALFNPSMVAHPDQSGVPNGELRVILSLRAVGEGHIS
jgi:hypothetical protein